MLLHSYFFFFQPETKLPNFLSLSLPPAAHLSIAHQRGVLPHQYVGTKEEDEGVAEAQQRPVQERSEGQQGVLADVPEGHEWFIVTFPTQMVQQRILRRG